MSYARIILRSYGGALPAGDPTSSITLENVATASNCALGVWWCLGGPAWAGIAAARTILFACGELACSDWERNGCACPDTYASTILRSYGTGVPRS